MVNKYHALIFNEIKGKTIIGVLVRLRFFPLKNCKLEKIVKKIKKDLLNNHMIMDSNFKFLTK